MKSRSLAVSSVLLLLIASACESLTPVANEVPSVRFNFTNGLRAAWSEPVHLGPPVNTPSADQSPALSPDGLSLYFASDRPGTLGGVDLWVSRRASHHSPWGTPVNLGTGINSPGIESGPNLSP